MNILNLPAPTAGAEFGQALGNILGQAGSQGLDVYTTNKAMELLDQKYPKTETMEDTNVEGSQFYNQRQQETMLRDTPWYLRSKVKTLMDQRNQVAGQEIQNANIYKDLGSEILLQAVPNADAQTQQLFGDYAIKLYRDGVSTAQASTILTQKAKKLGDSLASIASSPEISFNPFKRIYESFKGTFIPPEKLKENLAVFAKPFIELGAFDELRRIAYEKGLVSGDTEEILGYKISPQVTGYLSKNLKNLTPENLENQIEEVFKIDPNTNVLLLRNQLVDTGKVGFVDFFDKVSKLENEQRIKLGPDQRNQLRIAQKPEKDILRNIKEKLVGDDKASKEFQKEYEKLLKDMEQKSGGKK